MFQRRQKLTAWQHARELFWPSMGWRRAFRYAKYRILRLSDSTHKIAAGLAIGAAISFTPPGLHFPQVAFIAWVLRANILSALIGTFFGNPWTLPFLWWAAINFGAFLLSLLGVPAHATVPDEASFSTLVHMITHEPYRVFLPWAMGGYLLGVLCWPAFYIVFYYLVSMAKAAQRKKHRQRLAQAHGEERP